MTGSIAKLVHSPEISHEISKQITLAEFLAFDDGLDNSFYELENGELILMPLESEINRRIVFFLLADFLQLGIPYCCLSNKAEIVVNSRKIGVRIPDLVFFSEELVVEVVSPSQENCDYRYKRSEYASRGIMEYWVVDAIVQKVTIFQWVEGLYDELVFTGDRKISSPLLGELTLTAVQILQG